MIHYNEVTLYLDSETPIASFAGVSEEIGVIDASSSSTDPSYKYMELDQDLTLKRGQFLGFSGSVYEMGVNDDDVEGHTG